MLLFTMAAVLLVGVYVAIPWIEANLPGLAGLLGPVIQVIREWGTTVIPTPSQAINGVTGTFPG